MKEAIKSILSDKEYKDGMHVQQITDALILNFPDVQGDMTRDKLVSKVTAILSKEAKDK